MSPAILYQFLNCLGISFVAVNFKEVSHCDSVIVGGDSATTSCLRTVVCTCSTHFIFSLISVFGNVSAILRRSRYSKIAAFLEVAIKAHAGFHVGQPFIFIRFDEINISYMFYYSNVVVKQLISSSSAVDRDSFLC